MTCDKMPNVDLVKSCVHKKAGLTEYQAPAFAISQREILKMLHVQFSAYITIQKKKGEVQTFFTHNNDKLSLLVYT